MDRPTSAPETQLTIEKALQFAGDNSEYQKKRLLLLSLIVLSTAVLTAKTTTQSTTMLLLFLAASALGQLLAPLFLSLDRAAVALFLLSSLACLLYPLSTLLTNACLLLLGFFGRAFFASALTYLNEIGGQRFRAWSLIVVFGVWSISVLLAAWENVLPVPRWVWYYGLVFLPTIFLTRSLLLVWKPSPYHLFKKGLFAEAREVLNDMAEENSRPPQQHNLEGQSQKDQLRLDKSPSLYDLLFEPTLQKLTIPLAVLWVFREYIYFGSFALIPQVSTDYGKNFILISISETVAVLVAYPIRLKIRRVSTFFTLVLIITAASLACSFTTVGEECMQKGEMCTSKLLYRISLMLTRFSIALTGNVLASYTLQVYPLNLKHLAHTFLLSVSAVGSFLPCINALLLQAGFSGFISFALLSLFPLYLIPRLPETGGRVNEEVFVDWEKRAPLIPLENWNRLNF